MAGLNISRGRAGDGGPALADRLLVRHNLNLALSALFLGIVWFYATGQAGGLLDGGVFIAFAGVIGAYMALNIGANDVANNVGPAVGSKALTMIGALAIAFVFEAAGAIFAGGDVVATISKKIIDPSQIGDVDTLVWAMLAALLAAAVWVNLATWIGAPVSTTHAVVGGVMGSGLAAAGTTAVDWAVMSKIAASWVISPVLSGVIAALFLLFIKRSILSQSDKVGAARRWVPALVAVLAATFAVYMAIKGLKHVWRPEIEVVLLTGLAALALVFLAVKPLVARASAGLENRRKAVDSLFKIPLICAAALLCFAHGANDVANAIGPVAAIINAVGSGEFAAKVSVPLWVMLVGACGLSLGLALFGAKLVRRVGIEITRLDTIRAFCVALSASITVIVASWLGLPVSSTHIAVGGVFGVGFLREYLINSGRPLGRALVRDAGPAGDRRERTRRSRQSKRRLLRRAHLLTIVAAWLITVPSAALMSALIFFMLRGALLP
ncbi:MAG: anion permease [Alphaproteobacteria bacterium]|nr:anion permease [Alphaproteobacteria bacterium]